MKVISTHTFKHILKDIHKNTDNRKFCFVIGAGASLASGIPTGAQLANIWFEEIKNMFEKEELEPWLKDARINEDDLASCYGSIYRKRFENDKTSGYEFLVQAMKTATPSFGHIVLAQIFSHTAGHCVLTTNFDSLVESSIYQFTNKTPLVCGHESLSGYARPSPTHPLVIKIHRDLLLSPKSDPDEINNLDKGWKEPLDQIFSTHIPIVIGYGGNDGSLMSYFENMNKPTNFFWCGLNADHVSDRIKNLIMKHDGRFVKINGFDELMFELLWVFDEIKKIKEELNKITSERIKIANEQFDKISDNKNSTKFVTPAQLNLLDANDELSALEFGKIAEKELDLEKKKQIYLAALKKYPTTGWLWWDFTYFLHFVKKDYLNLDMYYTQALQFNKNELGILINYATFLKDIKKNYTEAERYYLKAIAMDAENADVLSNYAVFLEEIKKDYSAAEDYYLKAIALDPNNSTTNGNYASFLSDVRNNYQKAEKYYLKAIENGSENANNYSNYAIFILESKKDIDKAEEYLLKAVSMDPDSSFIAGSYANFLKDIKNNYDEAEKYYLKALSIDPDHGTNNGNYALFLHSIKGNNVEAGKYYSKAILLGADNANIIGNYADFLKNTKNDDLETEKYFLNAIELDSSHANNIGNYAQFLLEKGKFKEGEEYISKAFELNKEEESSLEIELWFYRYAYLPSFLSEAERKIEELLLNGVKSIGWNFSVNIEQAVAAKHPFPTKLKDFAERITTIQH